jgi:hypothetical protein
MKCMVFAFTYSIPSDTYAHPFFNNYAGKWFHLKSIQFKYTIVGASKTLVPFSEDSPEGKSREIGWGIRIFITPAMVYFNCSITTSTLFMDKMFANQYSFFPSTEILNLNSKRVVCRFFLKLYFGGIWPCPFYRVIKGRSVWDSLRIAD